MDRFALIWALIAGMTGGAIAATRAGPVTSVALGVALAAGAYLLMTRRRRRRARVADAPFPLPWRQTLERYVRFYERLETTERARFEREVAVFLSDHEIAGIRGAAIEDETRVLVAASAIMLSFGRPGFTWPDLRDVVVYPDAFDDEYQVSHGGHVLGMVHGQGAIVLSARALREGFESAKDGHNVGLHEFAHVLDFEGGRADGVPSLMPWRTITPWIALMKHEADRARKGRGVLRPYASTNEAELFAVATEVFFERPEALARQHPDLYEILVETYGQDPAKEPG